jgi:hypothetical protein
MIKPIYLQKLKEIIAGYGVNKEWQVFLFGSSLTKERFGDLDVGVMGKVAVAEIAELREAFKNSNLPYNVDVINFNEVSEEFKKNVFNNQIIWIKH